MKVAITGANGFVGKVVARRLAEAGHQVVAVVWVLDPNKVDFGEKISCYESDFSRADLAAAFQGADAIVHLAAARTTPEADAKGFQPYYEANVKVAEDVILAACQNGVSKICQASSVAAYSSANVSPYHEGQYPIPLSLYGMSKVACEHLGILYGRRFPLRVVSLRFAQVFGIGEREGLMMPKFVRQAREKQTLRIVGQGVGGRDYVYVKDIAGAIERAIAPEAPAGVFNIGMGHAISVRQAAEAVNEVFENAGNLVFETEKEENKFSFYMDCSRAQAELGWTPAWSLRSGLEDMKLWYAAG